MASFMKAKTRKMIGYGLIIDARFINFLLYVNKGILKHLTLPLKY